MSTAGEQQAGEAPREVPRGPPGLRVGVTLRDPLQVLVALACDLELDTLPCCAETHKWAWFRRYCMASRVAVALDRRTPLPRLFLDEVRAGVESPWRAQRSLSFTRVCSCWRCRWP